MKRIIGCLMMMFCVTIFSFSQNADYRNWKTLEEEMYNLAKNIVDYGHSSEYKEKMPNGGTINAKSNDGKILCEYNTITDDGIISYKESSYSYSEETGFYYDLYNFKGSPRVSSDYDYNGTVVVNRWDSIPRWYFSASRILRTNGTTIVISFNSKNIIKYGFIK